MDLGLAGKVALVTGGSKGIGAAIAASLAQEGVRVVLCARTKAEVERTASAIAKATGTETLGLPADVTRPDEIERVVALAGERFGGIDILVSNAGVPGGIGFGPLDRVEDANVMKDIETKFLGTLRASRIVVPAHEAPGLRPDHRHRRPLGPLFERLRERAQSGGRVTTTPAGRAIWR